MMPLTVKTNITAALILILILATGLSTDAGEPDARKQAESVAVTLATMKVTAEKRETRVQETPVSLTAISEAEIEDAQIWSTDDIVAQVPNLHMIKAGNHSLAGFLSLRGITGWMGGEPKVGFYVDDVYYNNFDTELLDVERVEVLRGPQGTLYGRNTGAGVVNIVSKRPDKERWQGAASAVIGNYNTQMYRAAVSGPAIQDKLYLRFAAKQTFSDGFFNNKNLNDDSADDVDDFSGRLTALWAPKDNLDVEFSSELMRFRDGNAPFNTLDQVRRNPHDVSPDYNGYSDYDATTQRLRIKYKADFCSVTAITALRNEENKDKNDLDFSPADVMRLQTKNENDLFSQEIRFASASDSAPFQWLAGLYYFDEKKDQHVGMESRTRTQIPPFSQIIKSEVDITGYAVFGQGSYRWFDKLRLTLGLRYDHEKKDFTYRQYFDPDLSPYGMTPKNDATDASWNELLPKISVDYTFRPGLMAYASVARGYKSGGFNNLAPESQTSYDPEYTTNYEVGLKSAWLGERLVLNLALFHIDWTDQQVEQQAYPQAITKNAAESTSRGFELEMAAKPLSGLHISGGFGYVDASFDDYTDDIIDASGRKTGTVDYEGKNIPNVPDYTYNLAVQYDHPLGPFARASLHGVGPFYWDSANTQKEDAYETVNAKLGWKWEYFQVYLWGKNVFDKQFTTRAFEMGGTWYGRAGDPATFGISLQGRF